jgi:DNA polymerase-3 subunit alpha
MNDNFVHLHVHSTYSFTDGYGLPEQYIARAKELGQTALGVTDHGNVSAHYKWYKQANKEGIKPILGCEMYIVANKEEVGKREYSHITVLVKNNVGYKNLMKLVTKAWCEQFYFKPRITYQDLFEHQEGLIVLSGCLSSPFMQLLKEDRKEEAKNLMLEFRSKIEDFYIEIQPIKFEAGIKAYENLINLYHDLKHHGMKWVATNDCHYVKEDQHKIQEILLCIQSHDRMSASTTEPDQDGHVRWKFDQDDFFLRSREQMRMALQEAFPWYDAAEFEKALDNTVKIADGVDFTFPKAEPIRFPMPGDEKLKFLHEKCEEGLVRILRQDDKDYRARMEYELDLISKKGFVDYFLVILDLVNWAKDEGILVGPARGSAAGSLVCYLVRITEVDPIPYDLLFERFIDINREDFPDIDIDFEDERRHEVKEYLVRKYGADRVGNLPTFAAFKGKSALHDVGTAFEIPFQLVDEVKGLVIERSGGDSRFSFTLEDTFNNPEFPRPREIAELYPDIKYAIELEGQYRQMGQHAAGVVISNEPLTDFCAIYRVKDDYIISLPYEDASDIGLLKIDLLGLSTLTVIRRAVDMVQRKTNEKIDLYTMPLNDPAVYKGFQKQKMFGVFQFDGQAVNQVCRQINPDEFNSLSAINALARPGPLNGGTTTSYILRKAGKERISYPHKLMKPYTSETFGLVVYQEQVMRTMREVGKMSWKDTANIRKVISKRRGVEAFDEYKAVFAVGARENGLSDKEIDAIWDSICTFGSWAFNKSHSVSYTIISYWTMWLKVHHPMEFYSAALFVTSQDNKRRNILKEYKREGFKVLPVDVNRSKESFAIDQDGIRIGFSDIYKIGPEIAKKIVRGQPYASFSDFRARSKVSESVAQRLADLGAFDGLKEHFEVNLFGEKINDFSKNSITFGERVQMCPWDVDFGIERDWMPFLAQFPTVFKELPVPIASFKPKEDDEENPDDLTQLVTDYEDITIMGVAYDKNLKDYREELSKGKKLSERAMKQMQEKHLYKYANFVLEDDTDFITVRLSTIQFVEPTCQKIEGADGKILNNGQLIFQYMRPEDVLVVRGKLGQGIRMFFANKILLLRDFKEYYEKHGKPQPLLGKRPKDLR